MSWMLDRWRTFWFAPARPTNLGFCRFLFFGSLLLYYLRLDVTPWAAVSKAFWTPEGAFSLLHLPLLPAVWLSAIQGLFKAALLFACVGLFSRVSTVVSFLTGLYVLGLPHNFGSIAHYDTLIVLVMATLALSRCGDAWSIDALLKAGRALPGTRTDLPESGEYTWPVRTIWMVMALVFFAAGFSKLRHSGLGWIFSDNMTILLLRHQYHIANADPLVPWGVSIARISWLTRVLAAASLIGELAYPLALVSRRARMVLVPMVFFMQVGIRALMGPTFDQYLICNLFWVPWDRVGSSLRDVSARRGRIAVLFDGACGLCQRTVSVLRRLDLLGRLEFYDVVKGWAAIHARFPSVNREACLADMHVILPDGGIRLGFDGYRSLAWRLPLGWMVLPFLYVPGVPLIGRRVYSRIAAARTCPVPLRPSAVLPEASVPLRGHQNDA